MKYTILVAFVGLLFFAIPVEARCRITNDTNYNFRVDSGHTYGQGVSAHSSTSIDSGDVSGESDDGREFSTECEDGDVLVVKEIRGKIRVVRR